MNSRTEELPAILFIFAFPLNVTVYTLIPFAETLPPRKNSLDVILYST